MSDDKKYFELEIKTLVRDGNWKELADLSKRAIENYPREPRFYSALADANYNLRKFKKAIKNYSRSINLDEQNFEAFNGRSQAKLFLSDYEGAKADYRIAVELNPDNEYIKHTGELIERAIKKSYAQTIHVKNYFSLENIYLDDLSEKKEIFFLGENGDGKTILLQSILLALKGNDGHQAIFKALKENDDLMAEGKKLSLSATDSNGENYVFEENYKLQKNSHPNIFAYGINRLRYSSSQRDNSGYLTLFDFNQYLSSPLDWLKEVERKEKLHGGMLKYKDAKRMLEALLENKVQITHNVEGDIVFKEQNKQIHFDQLSDGFKSIISWISDLLSKLSENQPDVDVIQDYKGIVLVDELGAYLHPNWEQKIVQKLRFWFPNIQFFFSTHSPLLLLGASSDALFFKLYKERGVAKISKPLKKITDLTVNSIITSPLFGLQDAVPLAFRPSVESLKTGNSFLSVKIHEAISEKISKLASVTESDISDLISLELDKLETKA